MDRNDKLTFSAGARKADKIAKGLSKSMKEISLDLKKLRDEVRQLKIES